MTNTAHDRSEGTLGLYRDRAEIIPLPETRKLVIASLKRAETAGKAVIKTFSSGIIPSACEILDRTTIQVLKRCDPDFLFRTTMSFFSRSMEQ